MCHFHFCSAQNAFCRLAKHVPSNTCCSLKLKNIVLIIWTEKKAFQPFIYFKAFFIKKPISEKDHMNYLWFHLSFDLLGSHTVDLNSWYCFSSFFFFWEKAVTVFLRSVFKAFTEQFIKNRFIAKRVTEKCIHTFCPSNLQPPYSVLLIIKSKKRRHTVDFIYYLFFFLVSVRSRNSPSPWQETF